jgi:hypothetical protein
MSPTLSDDELHALTGYRQPARQLAVLHRRGYWRAYRNRLGCVVLERPHYEAVCRGEAQQQRPRLHLKAA